MRKIVPGALAGLVVAAALAAPAYAATVSVRVEGDAQTLLPRTVVTTDRATGRQARQPDVPGEQRARRGERRDRRQLAGRVRRHVLELFVGRPPRRVTPDRGRPLLVVLGQRRRTRRAVSAACRSRTATRCCSTPTAGRRHARPGSPLRLTGVPAKAAPGATVTVKVEQLDGVGAAPAAAGDRRVRRRDRHDRRGRHRRDHRRRVGAASRCRRPRPASCGPRRETACVTTGSDGACGSNVPGAPGTPAARPRTTRPRRRRRSPA